MTTENKKIRSMRGNAGLHQLKYGRPQLKNDNNKHK